MKIMYMSHRLHNNQKDILKGWLEHGDEVCFISQYATGMEDNSIVKPIVMGYSSLFMAFYRLYVNVLARKNPNALDIRLKVGIPPMGKLAKVMREFSPDLVIMRERSLYTIFMTHLCRKYGYPHILYVMNPVWDVKKTDLAHRLVWKLVPRYRLTPSLVNGVSYEGKEKDECAFFAPYLMKPRMAPWQKEYMKDGIIRLFEVGKYQDRKNHFLMVEAFSRLHETYPNTRLTIAGQVSDHFHEEYYQKLSAYVEQMGLKDCVTLLKNQNKEQMNELYAQTDLFILPSTGEPGAVTHLEAMAYSIPAICGEDNGTTCYIEQGVTGQVFKDNDCDDLVRQMESIVKDSQHLKEMGANAYTHVCDHFQFAGYLDAVEQIRKLQEKDKKLR